LVAAGDPQPEKPMLHERAHHVGGQGRAAIRLGGPTAHEPADLVEAAPKTLCRFVDRHARDHSFEPRSGPSSVKLPAILPRSAGSRLSASAPSGLALAPLVPRRPPQRASRLSPLRLPGIVADDRRPRGGSRMRLRTLTFAL